MICVQKTFTWLDIRWEHILPRTQPKEFRALVASPDSTQPNRISKVWVPKFASIHPMPCSSMSFTQTPEVSFCSKYPATECRRRADTSTSIPTMVRSFTMRHLRKNANTHVRGFRFRMLTGKEQPGCALSQEGGTLIPLTLIKDGIEEASRVLLACNHVRAIKLFIDSINGKCPYVGAYLISSDSVTSLTNRILIQIARFTCSPSMSIIPTLFAGPLFQMQHRQLCHYGLSRNASENRLIQFIWKRSHTIRTPSATTTYRSSVATTWQILLGHRKRISILS